MMRNALAALAAALFLACAPAAAQEKVLERPFDPVDEAASDTNWVRFKNQLGEAIERQDRKFILSILDPKIHNGPGIESGVAAFRKEWDFDADPKLFWTELRRLVFLGTVYLKEDKGPQLVCAPYVTFKWPDDLDGILYGAIISRNVLVKAKPDSNSDTVATRSYGIVGVRDWEVADIFPKSPQKWVRIVFNGGEGYIPEEQIRAPFEHRACFQRVKDGWRMMSLVGGE